VDQRASEVEAPLAAIMDDGTSRRVALRVNVQRLGAQIGASGICNYRLHEGARGFVFFPGREVSIRQVLQKVGFGIQYAPALEGGKGAPRIKKPGIRETQFQVQGARDSR
jgi:hypothetical protein